MNCGYCEKPEEDWSKERPEMGHVIGVEYALCSSECARKWLKGRVLWSTKNLLKGMDSWPFEKFQSIFEFDTAGGYAQEKFNMMRQSPFRFLCNLDVSNIKKLAEKTISL